MTTLALPRYEAATRRALAGCAAGFALCWTKSASTVSVLCAAVATISVVADASEEAALTSDWVIGTAGATAGESLGAGTGAATASTKVGAGAGPASATCGGGAASATCGCVPRTSRSLRRGTALGFACPLDAERWVTLAP